MYFYTQFSHTTSQRFSAVNNNEKLEADLSHNDLYIDLLQEFYDKYDLPALHHDGDGFRQGDASDEEMNTLFDRIKEVHSTDFSNEISSMGREEVSNEEILEFLDKEFMSIEEAAYDSILEKYEDDSFQELKEKYDIETSSTSVYVCLDEFDSEGFDADDFVQEAEELVRLSQVYNELQKDVNIEYIETEEGNSSFYAIRAIFHIK